MLFNYLNVLVKGNMEMTSFISRRFLCPEELAILDRYKVKFKSSTKHPLYFYNTTQQKKFRIHYIKPYGKGLYLDRNDVGKAFGVYNGEGYQEYRKCLKELLDNVYDYCALIKYIHVSLDMPYNLKEIRGSWYDDLI